MRNSFHCTTGLEPLLLSIFFADLFFILNNVNVASYVDYNILYVIAGDINVIIASLQKASKALFEWFENNFKVMLTNIISYQVHISLQCYGDSMGVSNSFHKKAKPQASL